MALRVSNVCIQLVMWTSGLFLAGWIIGHPLADGVFFGSKTVRPNGAACLLIASAALYLLRWGKGKSIVRLLAALIIVVGAATLVEHAGAVDLRLDNALLPAAVKGHPETMRMSALAATAALLAGLALVAPETIATLSAVALALIAMASSIATAYRAPFLLDMVPSKPIAFIGAVLFGIWAIAFLCNARSAQVSLFFTADRWGESVRRLSALAVSAPVILGAISLSLWRHGLFDAALAASLVITATAATLTFTVVRFTLLLQKESARREEESRAAHETLTKAYEVLKGRLADLDGRDAEENESDHTAGTQDELAQYRVKIEELATRLATANAELESFSYSVSHDLRAPLRGIDGFSRELLLQYGDQLDATASHYLNRIRQGAKRMSELIDAMLQLARLSRNTMRQVDLNVTDTARRVADGIRERAMDRDIDFAIEPGLTTVADPHLLTIVFENLLGNAAKFSGGRDEARIEVGRSGGAFFVRDNGVGFDPGHAEKLFGAFQRLHGNEFEGTGIGLAIVQRIVHRHGGRIWAESSPGLGATFFFTLGES